MLRQIRFLFFWLTILGAIDLFADETYAGLRPFQFRKDSIAFPNELKWEYGFDDRGRWVGHKRKPAPEYSLHCFVLARTAAQFHRFAEFHPELPKTDAATYGRLVQEVSKRNLREGEMPPVIFPGYTNLFQFSADHERTLKAAAGGARQSYFQRGNWRMVFPFTRRNQERTATRLVEAIQQDGEALVHVVRFPRLDLNHAVLLFGFEKRPNTISFFFYDPNSPQESRELVFDREKRQFIFPRTDYFQGGPVNLYRIYSSWCY
ncbi:MAG: hypothetical protein JWM99_3852 [Verrucomicrobiales bacterium]|nr:hypothetical protein [Verrucomicrobiales bacterium]